MAKDVNVYSVDRESMNAAWRALARGRPGLRYTEAVAIIVERAIAQPGWLRALPPVAAPKGAAAQGVRIAGERRKRFRLLYGREWEHAPGETQAALARRLVNGQAMEEQKRKTKEQEQLDVIREKLAPKLDGGGIIKTNAFAGIERATLRPETLSIAQRKAESCSA